MNNSQNLIHSLNPKSSQNSLSLPKFLSILLIILITGGIVGYTLSKSSKETTSKTDQTTDAQPEKSAGISDKKTFKDKAEGVLKAGGMEGEGNFHLVRSGGESQNVYLTSSTVDLEPYINEKVRVWGETFQAEKAGWLMDVGLVELL